MKIVIFACIHGAGRSQMAAAFFNKHKKSNEWIAFAAGTQPAYNVHPEVVAVMHEKEIDLTQVKPTTLTYELAKSASLLVTMGCGEKCPFVQGLKIIDWSLDDPKGQDLVKVRSTRDQIEALVLELVKTLPL